MLLIKVKQIIMCALFGSNWNNGSNTGSFNWNLNNASGNVNRNIGRQLLCKNMKVCLTLPLGKK